MNAPFGLAVFCDDIRHEVNGKATIIGTYGTKMIVPSFPVTLPKFGIFLTLQFPASESIGSITIKVLRDEETVLDGEIENNQVSADVMSEQDGKAQCQFFRIRSMMVLAPVQIDSPSTIRVRAYTEQGVMKCGALEIATSDEPLGRTPSATPKSSGKKRKAPRKGVKS